MLILGSKANYTTKKNEEYGLKTKIKIHIQK